MDLQTLIDSSLTLKTIPPMIPILFYFLGTQTNLDDIQETFKNTKMFSYALLFQIIALPIIGLILAQVFSQSLFKYSIAIVLLAPGGFISGILTHYKQGNIPLSVTLTSLTSLISPFTLVIWLSIITVNADDFEFDFVNTLLQLIILIFLPYIIGFSISKRNFKFVGMISNFLDKFLKFYVFVITFTGPIELREALSSYFLDAVVIIISAIVLIVLIQKSTASFVQISKKNQDTIFIEAICQNFPIVLTFSLILEIPEIAIFGVLYYLLSLVVVVPYSMFMSKN
jgi:BASS family bile acid:Na+ symporter